MPEATDDGATMDDLAHDVRNASDGAAWNHFAKNVQDRAARAWDDDCQAVVMSLTVSLDRFERDKHLAILPAVAWAVDDVEATKDKLEDYGDAVVVWHRSHPAVARIRRKVADALED